MIEAQRHWHNFQKTQVPQEVRDRTLQVSSWPALKALLEAFSQKGCGVIPRAFVATSLAPSNLSLLKPWTPCASVMRTALGLPKAEATASAELNSFIDELSTWVNATPQAL